MKQMLVFRINLKSFDNLLFFQIQVQIIEQ